jgi:hypothetical protein
MELRNSLEGIVDGILDELLKSRHNICKCEKCILDMKAYALNRLPPKYIVSERGMIHSEMDNQVDYQFNADIIAIVSTAVETVTAKTRPGYYHYNYKSRVKSLEEKTEDYYFNLYHLIGAVYLNQKFDPAEGAKITLMDGEGKIVPMAEESWTNPYVTHCATLGLYAFWPAPIKSRYKKETAGLFRFRLTYELDGYKTKEKLLQFRIFSEKKIYQYVRQDYVRKVPPMIFSNK